MSRVVEQLLGYGVASLFALLADMAVLWLLVDRFSWSPFASAFVSFPVGALVAYVLSLRLAFHEHRLRDRRVEFAGFLAIGTFGLGVNATVIFVATKFKFFALHYLLAKCLAAGFTFLCNFFARRQFLFIKQTSPVRE